MNRTDRPARRMRVLLAEHNPSVQRALRRIAAQDPAIEAIMVVSDSTGEERLSHSRATYGPKQ